MSRPRREARIAHEWRERTFHTHERTSQRGRVVAVRCTRANCFRITRPDGTVRYGTDSEYGR